MPIEMIQPELMRMKIIEPVLLVSAKPLAQSMWLVPLLYARDICTVRSEIWVNTLILLEGDTSLGAHFLMNFFDATTGGKGQVQGC